MRRLLGLTALVATALTCFTLSPLTSAQAFEPSEYDSMSRPVGFGDDRRDPTRPIGFTRTDENRNRIRVVGASSLAAGNIIAVTVEGNGNVVAIEADQENSGDISNKQILNGRINLSR